MKLDMIIKCISLCCLLAGTSVVLTGCAAPGETSQEVSRRHSEVVRRNMLLVQDDVDRLLMLDEPSRASDKLIRP